MLYVRFQDSGKCQFALLPKHCISLFKGSEIGAGRFIGSNKQILLEPNMLKKNTVVWYLSPLKLPLIKCRSHLKRASFSMNSKSVTEGIDWSVLPSAWLGPAWNCPCDPIFRAHRHLHSLANSISKWQDRVGRQKYGDVCRNSLAERRQEWMILYHGQFV